MCFEEDGEGRPWAQEHSPSGSRERQGGAGS